ncbi:hypothetical protein BKA64DRAFT_687410 [Cadophora sp. MPI-SDFR-AT-0126]|nr:hypothetical protein BKA64DRAFT_687410 [Leotiomycetes sp. MPI-SDFR-AT-0126]
MVFSITAAAIFFLIVCFRELISASFTCCWRTILFVSFLFGRALLCCVLSRELVVVLV